MVGLQRGVFPSLFIFESFITVVGDSYIRYYFSPFGFATPTSAFLIGLSF